ncbi:MAG: SRPBCC family protein [Flavobacteriales bacterium]|nr:SRPBCC family protein [Flavobacteriales bacterium]
MAIFTVEISSVFPCGIERAFKTPMLCDITKVHTGYLFMPKVTHCEDDQNWGKPGGSRRVFMAKTLAFKGGEALLDTVIERRENEYWKIKVNEVKTASLGIHTFNGEWITTPISENETKVVYRYTLEGKGKLLYPFQWFLANIMWKKYMKQVLNNIRILALNNSPYLFD